MFLSFFESKGHLRMKSFSLVPHNDNSLLIINSGMAPLKPYFTGQEIPPRRRVTTCQKCIRTGDIENIGKTARHGTFFEMLGNFSFGDYFKKDAIHWAWEFLTERVGIPADRLYPSIYLDDEEAFRIWHDEIGIAEDRIYRFGKEDNFWEHGSGPCGPCSEIYYDRGEKYGTGPEDVVGGEGDRFMEVWNIVFSQYNNDGHGNYTDLIQKNIDTGMGLERLAVVCQDVDSIFDVDTLRALSDHVGEIAGVHYHDDPKKDVSIRIITDHIRSVTFMISDGIMPSNEGRGYVLRRLLRRAARHGRILGIKGTFLADLAKTVIATSKDGYPELEEKQAMIVSVIAKEENNFNRTLDQGLSMLEDLEEQMAEQGKTVLSGEDAFRLHDTFGFPLDLTREILEDKGLSVDEEGFAACMKKQKDTARNARAVSNYMGQAVTVYQNLDASIASTFCGYVSTEADAKVLVLGLHPDDADLHDLTRDEITEAITDGQMGLIITDRTPFYGTMGGQIGDTGKISGPDGEFEVKDTIHLQGGKIAHLGVMLKGMISDGQTVQMAVDKHRRALIARNHSATHLLQKALRIVLGDHVQQAGSLVTPDRLRFDFTHFQAMTPDEIAKTERIVNEEIAASLPVVTREMPVDEAKKLGAMALFNEKYGAVVRVVSMGDFSLELCGGTHVANTSSIACFKILSESGIASGVRRIEAVTSEGLMNYFAGVEKELNEARAELKAAPGQLTEKIGALQNEVKALKSENESLKAQMAQNSLGSVLDKVQEIGGVKLVAAKVPDTGMNELRGLSDDLKAKLGDDAVVVLASSQGGKVSLVVAAADGAVKKGAHAGNLIRNIAGLLGGGGGGRPTMAQAGGKNPEGIDAALAKAAEVLESQLH
ncbi:MAG: alanine--tRNA ligase [Lachnospiraceae bacterium]